MNKKKRIQMIILLALLVIAAAAFGILKLYQKDNPLEEEEGTEDESYPVLTIDQSQITDIGIISREGTLNLIKAGDEWKCQDEEDFAVDGSLVENFLTQASAITATNQIEDVTDMSEYGLDTPSVNITLQWDNNMYTIKLGDYNPIISGYYLNVNDDNTVYVVDSSLYYALNKSPEDFAPETKEGALEDTE